MRMRLAMRSEVGSATILAAMAGAAISAIVLSGMVQMMDLGFRSGKHIELKDDVNSIRRTILQSLDCSQTLATGNRVGESTPETVDKASGPDCDPSAPDHKLLLLKDAKGNSITTALETAAGPFQNSGKIGAWQVRTQCDRSSRTLIVRAARRSYDGGFSRDPLSKRAYDYEGNSLYLFGGTQTPICQAELGGAAQWSYIYVDFSAMHPLTSGGSVWPLNFDNVLSDARNEYSVTSRTVTIKSPGLYQVTAFLHVNPTVWEDGNFCKVLIQLNGTFVGQNALVMPASGNGCVTSLPMTLNLAQGDSLSFHYSLNLTQGGSPVNGDSYFGKLGSWAQVSRIH